jgi:membrane fusion protein, multidrug efflux system
MTSMPSEPPRKIHDHHHHNEGRAPELGGELEFELPPPAKPGAVRIGAIGVGLVVVLAGAFLIGWLPRYRAKKELAIDSRATESGLLRVQVVEPKANSSDRAMELSGSIHALEEAVLYPRASGYVRTWKADIGDKVEEHALLAEIDTPEIEQQLAQARAQLAQAEAALVQAKANRGYSQTTLERYKELAPKGVASQQELDKTSSQAAVDVANVEVAEANIQAQKANIGRYVQMQGFSRIVAPFSGTIISRTIERGALVSPSTPLFKISQADTVRVVVQVPQDLAATVATDQRAKVTVREYAGRTFEGKVARAAGALDPVSRTMTTEVRVSNPKHELLSGMYAQVALTLPSPHRVWEVPATAVMTDAKGVRVAVVEQGKLRLVTVTIERDNGATIDIATGLKDGDKVVRLGGAELVDDRQVEVAP